MIRDEVIKHLSTHGELSMVQLSHLCEPQGHTRAGVRSCLMKMLKENEVARIGTTRFYSFRLCEGVLNKKPKIDTRSHNPLVLLFDRRIREVRSAHEVGMATH